MTQPITILLVEDNVDDVELLRRFIRRAPGSYKVEIAYTGTEAIEKARVHPFEVMLVDQHLPDFPGEQLIAHMREAVPELPIVMLTGHGDERLAVEVMKAGAYDYLRKDDLEPQVLHRTLHNVLERARLEAEVRRANARLREWAIRDGLTGLYNHRHFQELLRTELARAMRYGQPLACLMIDLDHFKSVNDTYGHPFGDEVLKQVARTLSQEARKVDIIARYGGEEFVLVLPSTDMAGARRVGERICSLVAGSPVAYDGHVVTVTLSVGIATTEQADITTESDLMKAADAALYRAKRQGRNRVCLSVDEPTGQTDEVPAVPPVPPREFETELRRLYLDSIGDLLALSESTQGLSAHSPRVARLAHMLGDELGLSPAEMDALRTGAMMHDIGRLGVSDAIWLKPGPLDEAEQATVRQHTLMGVRATERLPLLEAERSIVRHHHERWDGKGYPDGLAGEQIPLLARVVGICDAFDALTTERTWRQARSIDEAMRILEAGGGSVYDPALVRAFFSVVRRLEREGGR